MKEDNKKKKKGMVVVIALGGKSPKSPEKTADPDSKKKAIPMGDAWKFLKMKETDKTGKPFSTPIARMRAGKEEHQQARMQMGNVNDPHMDAYLHPMEDKSPELGDDVPTAPSKPGGTINPASFAQQRQMTRSTMPQVPPPQHAKERVLDFSDPPNPFTQRSD
jgi:hypothetical protein